MFVLLLACVPHRLPATVGALQVETTMFTNIPTIELDIPSISAPTPVPGLRVEVPLVDDPRRAIAEAVDPDPVAQALGDGLYAELGATAPFAVTTDPGAPLLSVEISSWGVRQAVSGFTNAGPSTFWFVLRGRVFDPEGSAVFAMTHSCTYEAPAAVTDMPREAVTFRFVAAAEACGRSFVQAMRARVEPVEAAPAG